MYSPELTQASNFVEGVDRAFLVTLGISFLFLIGLTIVMIYFIYKYNNKRHPVATQIHGSTSLEITWTVIPFIITMVMFYYGWAGWTNMSKPPKDAMEVTVIGRMWNFSYVYENGRQTDTLYLPKDQAVKLNLKAMDVLHSFYIPAFRVKQDMVPNMKNNFMWFIPQRVGIYEIFCAEYCGLQHSYMYSSVKVMEDSLFQAWMTDTTQVATAATADNPGATGKKIMQNIGCFACHTIDGPKLVGPTFKGIWGAEHTVVTGKETRKVTVDEEYITRSIYDPNADVVEGYMKGLMVSYQGQLSEDDIANIIEYLKTVK